MPPQLSHGKKQHGYTLLELLTTLLIVAFLASFAIPSWQNHLYTARRTAAIALLMQTAARQEQFRSEQQRYASNQELTLPPPAGLGAQRTTENYILNAAATASTFTLTATAATEGLQAADTGCRVFGVDETGRYWSTDSWGNDSTPTCWRD
jgi:type IV pilus assembly protein PilE